MPEPNYATYTLRIGGNNFDKFGWEENVFVLNLQINYDGPATKNYTTIVNAKYNPINQSFEIIGGDVK